MGPKDFDLTRMRLWEVHLCWRREKRDALNRFGWGLNSYKKKATSLQTEQWFQGTYLLTDFKHWKGRTLCVSVCVLIKSAGVSVCEDIFVINMDVELCLLSGSMPSCSSVLIRLKPLQHVHRRHKTGGDITTLSTTALIKAPSDLRLLVHYPHLTHGSQPHKVRATHSKQLWSYRSALFIHYKGENVIYSILKDINHIT